MVLGALTGIIQSIPAGRLLGHPPAPESPTAAPGSRKVSSLAHPAEGMLGKVSVAVPPMTPAVLLPAALSTSVPLWGVANFTSTS
jgi:hypothetical protein